MRRPLLALLMSLPLLAARKRPPVPDHGIPNRILQQVRSGRSGKAASWVEAELKKRPDDLNLLAVLAIIHTANNEHDQAAALYDRVDGSAFYTQTASRFHADTLHELGEGARAAAIRTQRLHRTDYNHPQVQYENIARVHDLREAGLWLDALDICNEAIAFAPHQAALYAARAEIHIDVGDLDAAAFDLLLAEERGSARTGTAQTTIAKSRWLLETGQPNSAVDILTPLRQSNFRHERFAAALGEAMLASHQSDAAAVVLRQVRFRRRDSAHLQSVRARLLLATGDRDGAVAIVDDLMDVQPGNLYAQAIFAEVYGFDL